MKGRVEIIVKGDVQRVGYRDRVERIARKLNITGFVENLKPYDVRIIAEGEKRDIDRFIKEIEIKKSPIFVEELKLKREKPKGEYEYFEIKRGSWQEELGERLDTTGTLLYRSVELSEKSVGLSEKSVELGEESVSIGRRMLDKQDQMLDKQDRTIDEIKGAREDLKSYMERRFRMIEYEITRIKEHVGIE